MWVHRAVNIFVFWDHVELLNSAATYCMMTLLTMFAKSGIWVKPWLFVQQNTHVPWGLSSVARCDYSCKTTALLQHLKLTSTSNLAGTWVLSKSGHNLKAYHKHLFFKFVLVYSICVLLWWRKIRMLSVQTKIGVLSIVFWGHKV